jgi:molybdopterin synthase catalytic subunit
VADVVRVQEADFDVGAELAALRRGNPQIGALASFVGLVRDTNDGPAFVAEMTLEHYPGNDRESARSDRQRSRADAGRSSTRW